MKNIDIQSDDTKKYEYIIHTKNYKKNILLTKYNQIIEYIDSNFTVTSNMSFLEIGFNDGLLFKSLQKKYPKAKFIGVEVRQSCVDNMVKQGFDCRLITNELFPIDEKFDVIYGASVLHHISKPFDFIKHLFNALNYNKITRGGGGYLFLLVKLTDTIFQIYFIQQQPELGNMKNIYLNFQKEISSSHYKH
ncbi:class I SAM-dependent methyltransferase [Lawsonia intracellularis]|uniref:class I SAM-dependent methyltransferase n=1 Tax=Lawsonia intracellularis TaxID=29546 RepID=UPI00215D339F|nr:class I SAM-dependent methyltransferase [Lawsonia intracellularis]